MKKKRVLEIIAPSLMTSMFYVIKQVAKINITICLESWMEKQLSGAAWLEQESEGIFNKVEYEDFPGNWQWVPGDTTEGFEFCKRSTRLIVIKRCTNSHGGKGPGVQREGTWG